MKRGLAAAGSGVAIVVIVGMVLMGFHVIRVGNTIDFTHSGGYILFPVWALVAFPAAVGLLFGSTAWGDHMDEDEKRKKKEVTTGR